ncbi:MAG TPA: hypothetical protein PLV85_14205, partial [Polyangiaceae bacterium]|nr:hypothetical protein [Polyangiaceae bacterium]
LNSAEFMPYSCVVRQCVQLRSEGSGSPAEQPLMVVIGGERLSLLKLAARKVAPKSACHDCGR